MAGHGRPAQVQAPGDGRIGQALSDQVCHFDLARGKGADAVVLAREPHPETAQHRPGPADPQQGADRLEPLARVLGGAGVLEELPAPASD